MIGQIQALQIARGQNAKQDVLRSLCKDHWFRTFLYYALNPFLKYNLSEAALRKAPAVYAERLPLLYFNDIFECCEFLSQRRGVDEAVVMQVKVFLYFHCTPSEREIYIKLLAKTLRLGVTAKTVNKIIPGLIPEWSVQQAYPIDKYPIQDGTEFWLTQKLNGVRATLYQGQIFSRSGQPYRGLGHILSAIGDWARNTGLVLDGELTLKNKGKLSDNEAFRIAVGILNSDATEKQQIGYTIFDVVTVNDFESSKPRITYSNRRAALDAASTVLNTDCTRVLPVLYHGSDQQMIWKLLDKMVAEDKEGLVLNTDVPYYRNRHAGVLKVKRFYTMDLPILRCEEGNGRLAGKLGAFVLDFRGNEVKVGTGFSDEQRSMYWLDREQIEGMLCEVKYKEISSDKSTGLSSLQFPVFIRLRDDKCDVSYG